MMRRGLFRWILPPLVVAALATGAYLAVRGPGRHPAPSPSPAASAGSTTPDTALLVPWIDASPQPLPSITPSASVRLCRASDLAVGDATEGGTAIHSYFAIIRNVGTLTCRLPGAIGAASAAGSASGISLVTLYVGGQVLPVQPTFGTGQGYEDVVLRPLDHLPDPAPATANLFLDLRCSQQTPTSGVITFPGGGERRFRIQGPPQSETCNPGGGPSLTGFLTVASSPLNSPLPGGSVVSGYITDVEATTADGRLRFIVRLENFSDAPVSLDPCPSYEEGFTSTNAARHSPHVEEHLLNCVPLPQIPPRSAVRFEMYLSLPSDLRHQPGILSWRIDLPDGTLNSSQTINNP